MTANPTTIAHIEDALERAKRGELQSVMIVSVSSEGHGVVQYNMDDDTVIQTLDWLEAAFSEPEGEVTTYVVH